MNGPVRALTVSNGDLYAAGEFTTAGGKVAGYLARAKLGVQANAISASIDGSDFTARYEGTPGITYTIEYTADVSAAAWQKLTNLTAPTNDTGMGMGVFELRDGILPSSRWFYRAVYPAY